MNICSVTILTLLRCVYHHHHHHQQISSPLISLFLCWHILDGLPCNISPLSLVYHYQFCITQYLEFFLFIFAYFLQSFLIGTLYQQHTTLFFTFNMYDIPISMQLSLLHTSPHDVFNAQQLFQCIFSVLCIQFNIIH